MPAKFITVGNTVFVVYTESNDSQYDFEYWLRNVIPKRYLKRYYDYPKGKRLAFDRRYFDKARAVAEPYFERVSYEHQEAPELKCTARIEPPSALAPKPAQAAVAAEPGPVGFCRVTMTPGDYFTIAYTTHTYTDDLTAWIDNMVPKTDWMWLGYDPVTKINRYSVHKQHFDCIAELAESLYRDYQVMDEWGSAWTVLIQEIEPAMTSTPVVVREVTREQLTLF